MLNDFNIHEFYVQISHFAPNPGLDPGSGFLSEKFSVFRAHSRRSRLIFIP